MSLAVAVIDRGGATTLDRALVAEAVRWGEELSGGTIELTDDAVAAVDRRFAGGAGPVVIVWPALPRLRAAHAAAVRSDLADGCELVLGPLIDGGFYLVGLARPLKGLQVLAEGSERDADVIRRVFAAAQETGTQVGLLRAERGLRSPADARAALADPCLPERIRGALSSPPSASGH